MHYMRISGLALLISVCALAQDAPAARGVVDGKPVNQAQMEALIALVPEQLRGKITSDEGELLRYYGFVCRMAEYAESLHLAEQSPYKEQLEVGRKAALAIAAMGEYSKNIKIPDAEVERYYQQHKDQFTTMYVTAIQVPIAKESEEAAAKAKADSLWNQIKGGVKFDTIEKQYPVPGFKSFSPADPQIPAEVKTALAALEPGGITRPVAIPNGVYLFRLDKTEVKSFRDVYGDVLKTMQDTQFQKWMDGIRGQVVVGKPGAR
jgi:parvulin-like peptidyl-prolyl isomerase